MKIKDYITGYEEMTEEEKAKALEEFEVPDMNDFVRKTEYDKVKVGFDKSSSEVAQLKREKRENMSEAERVKLEYEDKFNSMEEELKGFKRQSVIDNYGKRLAKLGFENADTMAESLPNDIGDDFFIGLEKWKADAEKAIKANIVMGTPRPEGGGKPENTITKEQFEKMTYEEMLELKNENPEVYAEMVK